MQELNPRVRRVELATRRFGMRSVQQPIMYDAFIRSARKYIYFFCSEHSPFDLQLPLIFGKSEAFLLLHPPFPSGGIKPVLAGGLTVSVEIYSTG